MILRLEDILHCICSIPLNLARSYTEFLTVDCYIVMLVNLQLFMKDDECLPYMVAINRLCIG